VTTLKRLPSARFRVAERFVERCSWGATPVLVHLVDPDGAIDDFVAACRPQLDGAAVPESLRPVVAQRVVEQDVGAASDWVELVRVVDGESGRVLSRATRDVRALETCWLVDHALTWSTPADARAAVDRVDGLRTRVLDLLETADDETTLCDDLLRHPLAGCYRVRTAELRDELFWFLPDELGAAAARSAWGDETPPDFNCVMAPIFDLEERLAFSVLWPSRDIEAGDFLVAELRGHRAVAPHLPDDALPSLLETGSGNREILDFALRPALEKAMAETAAPAGP